MNLYIVRHGETGHNKRGILQGHFDSNLNRLGIKQAKLLAKRLEVVIFDYIYSSDSTRAKRTTEEIIKFQNCPVKYVKSLRERNLGRFNNKPRDQYYNYLKENKLEGNLTHKLPGGGESYLEMQKRVASFVEKIYKKHKDETILLSTHGGAKRVILLYLNKTTIEKHSIKPKLNNASLSIIKFHHAKKHKIILENDIKHLK